MPLLVFIFDQILNTSVKILLYYSYMCIIFFNKKYIDSVVMLQILYLHSPFKFIV